MRVHVKSALRDLVGNELEGRPSWSLTRCLKRVADAGKGVVVLLAREEGADQLLESVEMALGNDVAPGLVPPVGASRRLGVFRSVSRIMSAVLTS